MSNQPTIRMQQTLATASIPAKQIQCYGNQIVITSWSRTATEQWALLLGRFSRVRGITESYDETVKNSGTCLKPSMVKVWRTFAVITAQKVAA